MLRKKAFFFTIDAFIAIFIVVTGLIILLSNFAVQPYKSQAIFISEDVINFFASTKVGPGDTDNQLLDELRRNGNITNYDNTLLEQIAEFQYTNRNDLGHQITKNLTYGLLEARYGFQISINDTIVYNTSFQKNDTDFLVTSRRIVFGINGSTGFWGPTIGEVRVWLK